MTTLTDEQIRDLWRRNSWDSEGTPTSLVTFARALLSASIADTAGAKLNLQTVFNELREDFSVADAGKALKAVERAIAHEWNRCADLAAPPAPSVADAPALFYLQDSRSFVGNDVMWWAKDGNGYTTDLRKAHVYTKAEAQAMHNERETDIPWPKEYIDQKWRPAVDFQYIKRDEALRGSGIELVKPAKPRRDDTFNCEGCGRFINERNRFDDCQNCGTNNRY